MPRNRFIAISLFFALLLQIFAAPIDPYAGTAYAATGIPDPDPAFSTNITPDRPIKITFSEPVRRETGSIIIKNSSDAPVRTYVVNTNFTDIQMISTKIVSISTAGLAPGSYKLIIPDTAFIGVTTETPFAGYAAGDYNFTVVAAIAAPTLSPANGATRINTLAGVDLTLTFAQPSGMKKAASGSIFIRKYSDNSIVHVYSVSSASFDASNQIATIPHIETYLDFNTQYYVTVDPGAFTDMNDNPYAGITDRTKWSFTTLAKFDDDPPKIVTINPVKAGNLSPATSNLVMTFDETVYAGSGTIEIHKKNGNAYQLFCSIPATSTAVTINSSASGKIVTIAPANVCPGFTHNADYKVIVDSASFRDLNGNYFLGTDPVGPLANLWTFTVKVDTTPPPVSGYSPAAGSTNVPISTSTLKLTFNEAVTVSGNAAVFPYGTSSSTNNLTNPTVSGNIVTYTLTGSPFKAGTRYTVRIPDGAIKDAFGNAIVITDPNVWTFTTVVAGNVPLLNKAEMDGSAILLTFSENLETSKIPAASNFSVTVNNASNPVTGVTISNNQVTLALQNGVLIGQIVKIGYTLNTNRNNRIQSVGLREAGAFSNRDVTNTTETTLPKPSVGTASGSTIVLTFNKSLADLGTNAKSQFFVLLGSQVVSPSSISAGGTSVMLDMPSTITTTGAIRVSYTPGAAPLKDLAGNSVAAFSAFNIVNPNDTTAPTLSSSSAVGSKVVLNYSESLRTSPLPSLSSFSIVVGGVATAISSIDVHNNVVELTLATPIAATKQVTVSYVQPLSNYLTDLNYNAVPNINALQITGAVPLPTKLSAAAVKDATLTMTYSATLNATTTPPAGQYTVKVDGTAVTVSAVNVAGSAVTLTLGSPVKYRQGVTVSFVNTGIVLKDAIGQTVEASTDFTVTNSAKFLDGLPYLQIDGAGGFVMPASSIDKQSAQTKGGRTANKYMVAADKLDTAFAMIKTGFGNEVKIPRLTIQVPTSEAGALVSLPVTAMVSSAAKVANGLIRIEFGGMSWELPLTSTNWAQAAQNVGSDAASSQLLLKIEKLANNALSAAVGNQGGKVAGSPVDFSAVFVSGGVEKELAGYDLYIRRTINVSASELNASELVVVRQDGDSGDVVYVPTKVEASGTDFNVIFLRKGNSVYAVASRAPSEFSDMTTHWATEDVAMLASKFIVTGTPSGTYNPNTNITRADFAEFIARGLGLTGDRTAAAKFSDINGSSRSATYIGAANKAGIVSGDTKGTFRPNANITREEMASMMIRAMRYAGVEPTISDDALDAFTDKAKVSGWAKDSVGGCVNAGLISGVTPTTIKPRDNATRAQAASMIKRLLQYVELLDN